MKPGSATGEALSHGDRVRFTGAGKDWIGTVTERRKSDGTKSIHPRMDDTAVYVTFDETGISVPVSIAQLQKVLGRQR